MDAWLVVGAKDFQGFLSKEVAIVSAIGRLGWRFCFPNLKTREREDKKAADLDI
jgi:hypothetical protein